jgi:hypothetical protein
MTKEELQVKIGAIESMIADANTEVTKYGEQLAGLKKQHADLSKPKLTMAQFDQLTELIEEGIEEFDFDDLDSYSIDYGIDYDNRVTCESFCFDNVNEVARVVCDKVYKMFAEATEDDSDNS